MYIFEGLRRGSTYIASVSAEAKDIKDRPVKVEASNEQAMATTIPSVELIGEVELAPKSASSFEATWKAPIVHACRLTGFEFKLCNEKGEVHRSYTLQAANMDPNPDYTFLFRNLAGSVETRDKSYERYVHGAEATKHVAKVIAVASVMAGADGRTEIKVRSAESPAVPSRASSLPDDPDWTIFLAYWNKVKLKDLDGYSEWQDGVCKLFWMHWPKLKFIYLWTAASGHTDARYEFIDAHEFSALLTRCNIIVPRGSMPTSEADLLLVACDKRYTDEGSPKGLLTLYQFLDILVRISLQFKAKQLRAPKAKLPACLEDLVDNYILKGHSELIQAEELQTQAIASPESQAIFSKSEAQLRSTYDQVATLDEQEAKDKNVDHLKQRNAALEKSSLIRMKGWLSLFQQRYIVPKIVTRAQTVLCFALAQEHSDVNADINLEEHMARLLDFEEFKSAVGRMAFLSFKAIDMNNFDRTLRAYCRKLGPFIKDLAAEHDPEAKKEGGAKLEGSPTKPLARSPSESFARKTSKLSSESLAA
uniref:Uncharacterized protein n=1 Tax=Haptolina brevifila TaxID=156173 RepID=A0A7S2D821_9EUKA